MYCDCMHRFHSAHLFIVCNSVICTTNYTAHCVYSPLNSYVYMHWILDFKYILLLLTLRESLGLVDIVGVMSVSTSPVPFIVSYDFGGCR